MRPWQRVHSQDQREQSRRQQTQSSCPGSCAQSCWRQWRCSHARWTHAFNSMAIFHFLLKLHSLGTIECFSRNPNKPPKKHQKRSLLLGSCKGKDAKNVVQVLPMKMMTIFKSLMMDRQLFTMISIILQECFWCNQIHNFFLLSNSRHRAQSYYCW